MGKISPVTNKYTIVASFKSKGTVEKPDIIGAVFGQTEGLLGNELELRELQKSGRIGRIDVEFKKSGRKYVQGEIIIPSSLNQAETALIAAAVETIDRIGPADAEIKIKKIEDVRVKKRNYVLERAKELLRDLVDSGLPDSREISDEVFKSVRAMEIGSYGKDKLPCGPGISESDEVILVEGRADVINLLRYGFRNVISMNGSHVPQTIIDLSKEKEMMVFIDGDRGGKLIVSELKKVAEVDFVAMAPPGKEVEELTSKEVHKAIRAKVPLDQAKFNVNGLSKSKTRSKSKSSKRSSSKSKRRSSSSSKSRSKRSSSRRSKSRRGRSRRKSIRLSRKNKESLKKFGEDLVGSQGAFILDDDLSLLGKVPVSELVDSLKQLDKVSGVVIDGKADASLVEDLKKEGVSLIVSRETPDKRIRGIKLVRLSDL